jgi:RND superfamily putative drug exporter
VLLSVITAAGPQSSDTLALVERLRDALPPLAGSGAAVFVGGEPAQNQDLNDQVGGSVPKVVGAVLILSFVLLLLAFRSIFIAAKAVLTTLLSVLAVYGVLVLVFQDGHGASLLSVQPPGFVEVFLPLFLFCILFGLSMDYEVFLLTEVRQEYLAGASCRTATLSAVRGTAGIITTAAAIMVTVFGAFAFTSLTPIQAIGFGLAVAVLLDATVVRLVLVPAVLVLLGDRNFWLPRWLDRRLPGARREPVTGPARPARRRRRSPRSAPAPATPAPDAPAPADAAPADAGAGTDVVSEAAAGRHAALERTSV